MIGAISLLLAVPFFLFNARWLAAESAQTVDRSSNARFADEMNWENYVVEHGKVMIQASFRRPGLKQGFARIQWLDGP